MNVKVTFTYFITLNIAKNVPEPKLFQIFFYVQKKNLSEIDKNHP